MSRGKRRLQARKRSALGERSPKLDRDITEVLHATKKTQLLDRNEITEAQALALPRFEFIAHWLEVVTRKKEGRILSRGKRVKRTRGRWQIVYSNGLVEYETPDADLLFDYARRGPLGWHIRAAEEFRALAHQRALQ